MILTSEEEINYLRKKVQEIHIKPCEPITISINKQYFREKFEKIFSEWDQKLWHGIDKDHQKELLDNLMKCFDDQKSKDITST